ncbi:anti-sigma factor [Paraburkholderia monticola]|uniref:Anti-sigma factor n=1 Tax=Paraburkholderia monticola TaxID=1399968 RepID=A0A149PN62_9BURK|nr:anti-sigma factor [Paraburkholderia monticola]KXU86490.1 anti-sigma factor [Paraburkholderia monticola]
MNTPLSSPDDLRCAEYVLGVLDAAGRRQIELALQHDRQLAASVARWQNRLMPLNEDIGEIEPASYVWARIQSELGFAPVEAPRPRVRLWDDVRWWRWIGIGSSFAAMALVILLILPVRYGPVVGPSHDGYKVASIVRDGGAAGWTAIVDVERARMVIVPAYGNPVAADRSTELWLIAPGERPVSLGVIAVDRPTIVALPQTRLALLNERATLAVSLEPHGGSPSGQPTGPVLAKGVVGGA